MGSYVEVSGVARAFGEVIAVDDASFVLEKGQLLALLGPSGCGKTTLLRLIGGLDRPGAGTVIVDGEMLNGPGTFVAPERRRIGMVFQDYALFPHLDVGKNVAFGLPRGASRRGRTGELLDLVGLPSLEKRMPHELSGGQQQRVALARALAGEPRLLLLDEPFSNLDPSIRARVRTEVRELLERIGITAIFVTHDQDEALSLADTVAVMIEGRIRQTGTPREVYECPATRQVAEFIGQPNFLSGDAEGGTVTCELGVLPLAREVHGPVAVLIRSEDIVRAAEGGQAATVESVGYYGHEEVVTLRLPSGVIVRARWRAGRAIAPGDTVRVAVCGRVLAYEDA